jgi:hypothetical protein
LAKGANEGRAGGAGRSSADISATPEMRYFFLKRAFLASIGIFYEENRNPQGSFSNDPKN